MQAVKQPDEIAVSADDLASSPLARDFIVVVLEQEQAFFFWQKSNTDRLFDTATCASSHSTSRGAG